MHACAVEQQPIPSTLSSNNKPNQTKPNQVLALPKHRLSVQVRRAGGGFGAKLTRCYQNAAAAAVCARKLGRPVRVSNDRTTDMVMVGGREPLLVDYDVGFDDQGMGEGERGMCGVCRACCPCPVHLPVCPPE